MNNSVEELKYSQRIARIGYYVFDIEKDIWTSSEMLNEIFGIDEEFIKNAEGCLSIIHPEFRDELINHLSFKESNKDKEFNKKFKIINKKTNSVIWVQGLGSLEFNAKGKLIKMFGTIQDITEQMQINNALLENQHRYELAQKLGHVGSWEYNFETELFWVSDESKRIYGLNLGDNYFDIERVENCIPERERVNKALMDLIEHDKKYDLEFEIIPEDLSPPKIIHSIAKLERDADNKPLIVRGVILDITERKKIEQLLIESNATKDKFFSIIAHDLRGPFNNILGFTELVIENTNKLEVSEYEKYFGIINSSAKKTLLLLDDLLDWAKSQTGQISFNPQKQVFSSTTQEIFKLLNESAKNKNITLNFFESENIEVFADTNMFKTILRNLISNAIKFTDADGKINVYATQNDKFTEIAVHDNGVGIHEERQNKLFGLEVNESSYGTANEKGTGLGLTLCKEFVEKHGGKIWVESKLGKESVFKFTLPLQK